MKQNIFSSSTAFYAFWYILSLSAYGGSNL